MPHEVRLRNVDKKLITVLQNVCNTKKLGTLTQAAEYIISNYQQAEQHTAQLQQRNNELHKKIARYVQLESHMIYAVEQHEATLQEQMKYLKETKKKFKGNAK